MTYESANMNFTGHSNNTLNYEILKKLKNSKRNLRFFLIVNLVLCLETGKTFKKAKIYSSESSFYFVLSKRLSMSHMRINLA